MTAPLERFVELPAGRFRYLDWPGTAEFPPAVLLHGLTAVADVWRSTVDQLTQGHGRIIAPDLRGHGHSARPGGRGAYTAWRMARDVVALVECLGLETPHVVGHSMGARVAIMLAARYPTRFRSAVIVDIGPEAWAENIEATARSLERMPRSFPSRAAAREFAFRGRAPFAADEEMFFRRLAREHDGSYRWLGSPEAMIAAVRSQRRRSYWEEWQAIDIPALFIRGGETREVRASVAAAMRRRNPRAAFVEFDAVGHNIPLLAPGRLAAEIDRFWRNVERRT